VVTARLAVGGSLSLFFSLISINWENWEKWESAPFVNLETRLAPFPVRRHDWENWESRHAQCRIGTMGRWGDAYRVHLFHAHRSASECGFC
jgi:hypothetical protein